MSSQDEVQLILSASAGDRVALTQLLLTHHDALQHHIRQQLASAPAGISNADDVLQQTYVRAAQAIGRFESRPAASFRGWLKTIATNLIKDARKRWVRERRAPATEQDLNATSGSLAFVVEHQAADNTPPIRRVQAREHMRRLRVAVARLPREQRDIIERYYLLNESLQQIAEATGRSKSAIRGICYRARQQLRSLMGGSSLYFSN